MKNWLPVSAAALVLVLLENRDAHLLLMRKRLPLFVTPHNFHFQPPYPSEFQ